MEAQQYRKRVLDSLALRTPDKVPFHAYESPELVMREAGRPVHEMYLDAEMFLDAMFRAQYLYHNDIVAMRVDPYLIGEMLTHSYESRQSGSLEDLRFAESDEGLLVYLKRTDELLARVPANSKTAIPVKAVPPLIRSHADIEKIEVVPWQELVQRPRWAVFRHYVAEFKGKRFLAAGVGAASANLLDMYLGTAEAMMATLNDPGFCRAIMDRHFEQLKQRILAAKVLGADGITTGDACASCSFFSPATYHALFFPAHKRVIEFIHDQGLPATLHVCGKINPILEMMADTGADVIEGLDPPSAGGDIDLRDAKRRVGKRVCLKGNMDAVHVILPGPAEAVYRACREALEAAGPDGYILSTEQIPRDTPTEHVLAMVQARDDQARQAPEVTSLQHKDNEPFLTEADEKI